MNPGLRSCTISFTTFILALGWFVWSFADEFEATHELTLADLTAYGEALSDKVTASNGETSEPSQAVSLNDSRRNPTCIAAITSRFKDVSSESLPGPGRQFSPLAEIWITSPAGDPFCLVVPQKYEEPLSRNDLGPSRRAQSTHLPQPGLTVRDSQETFLKMVRFAAGDMPAWHR